MATATIRPNGDNGPNAWMIDSGSCALHHDCVDEVTPDGNILFEGQSGFLDLESFDMDNVPSDVGTITGIKVWYYGKQVSAGSASIFYYDGAWQGPLGLTVLVTYSWSSVEWTGLTLTKAQGDALAIRMRAETLSKGQVIYCNTLYAVITYSLAVSGWGHKFNGVANANIAKINGVAIANIAKINGV